jgi:hypothetical protein
LKEPVKDGRTQRVLRVLSGLVGILLVWSDGRELLHPAGGLYIITNWFSFVAGLVLLLYAASGWALPTFGRPVFSGASGSEVVLRVLAAFLSFCSMQFAFISLFMVGSLLLCGFFVLAAVAFGLFAATGWPLSVARRKREAPPRGSSL